MGRIRRIGPVLAASATAALAGTNIYRNDLVPAELSGGISVLATQLNLPATLRTSMASGTWLNAAHAEYPAVVLGAKAARWLGVGYAAPEQLVYLAGRSFAVVGILEPVALAPELDQSALIGWPVAEQLLGFDGNPGTVYVRTYDDAVGAVRAVLAATTNPERPDQVRVSRPSDALPAKRAAEEAFAGLFLGLAAVALLVGGIGVANTMVISVLERRSEVGLRRALGATRGQIRSQFLIEAILLALLGGGSGALLGSAVTAGYAVYQQWPVVVPPGAVLGGLSATVVVGALAGLYPAVRASRLAPTEALTAP
jgi:putative ABC transport system permease protein